MEENKKMPPQENIMGTMEIKKLLITLSVPMMISMLVQALYNVVDSIFVSRVSENALTAVSLAFPVQSIMIAVGVGTAVGVNALLSKSLGEKNFDLVNKTATNAIFLALSSCAVFMAVGLLVVPAYFRVQTTDAEILSYGTDYLTIVCLFSQGFFMTATLEKLLTSTGLTKYTMLSQMSGAITNIILDPIFIFGYMGQWCSGTRGAAIATVLGQFVSAGVGIYFNLHVNKEISFSFKGFRPHLPTIQRIYTVGAPSIAMQCVGSVMTFGMNHILMGFSATAVAVFGVYFKLQSFVLMPLFGMNSGVVPIISYNYGACRPDRVAKTVKTACAFAECIMVVGLLLFQFVPNLLLGMFNASPEMERIGVAALRTISWHFPIAGVCIIFGSTFQALGKGMYSLYNSLARQIVLLLPAAWLLSKLGKVEYIWFSFIIAEFGSLVMSTLFMYKIQWQILKPLYEKMNAGQKA